MVVAEPNYLCSEKWGAHIDHYDILRQDENCCRPIRSEIKSQKAAMEIIERLLAKNKDTRLTQRYKIGDYVQFDCMKGFIRATEEGHDEPNYRIITDEGKTWVIAESYLKPATVQQPTQLTFTF